MSNLTIEGLREAMRFFERASARRFLPSECLHCQALTQLRGQAVYCDMHLLDIAAARVLKDRSL